MFSAKGPKFTACALECNGRVKITSVLHKWVESYRRKPTGRLRICTDQDKIVDGAAVGTLDIGYIRNYEDPHGTLNGTPDTFSCETCLMGTIPTY